MNSPAQAALSLASVWNDGLAVRPAKARQNRGYEHEKALRSAVHQTRCRVEGLGGKAGSCERAQEQG